MYTFRDYYNEDCGCDEVEELVEAEYQGKSVTLNKPQRSQDGKKKFYVHVKN